MMTERGDGTTTLFWEDRWLHGKSIADLAPSLMPHVKRTATKTRTVQQALQGNQWLDDFGRGLVVLTIWEFLLLWNLIQEVQLTPGVQDEHRWRFSSTGHFSSRSAYLSFFHGSTAFEPHKRLWSSWAPLRAKLFLWMAIMNRCWTADRLSRKGLDHPEACPFCDQQEETIEHILL
ncbi:hypothetical protein PR202_ga24514 [Eleusine coracana subsp. coracana]|uniref:Reverse transcriptase zinc-binding domain-containing protein n=1 Tax=Eleusine coracana subsp. coracana TaxID=191504 RepID=A0AAV5D9A6_ELECO|nr:hypothetical protein PR202_ga24514 [Eleusine coracana subsp. coracana]